MANNRELSQFANVVGYNGGKIGIGTDNPDASLHIHKDDASSFDAIWMSGRVKRKNVIKVNNSDNLIIGVDENNEGSASNFRLQIDGSEKLRVDSSGRMLLGTTTVPTGLVLGNSLTAASSTGAEVVAFRSDTSVAVGDKCGAFVIGNSDTDGVEDHFVGMWGKVASTNGSMDLHFAAGRASYENDNPDVTIKSGGDVGIGTDSNNDGAHFQHYQSEVRHQSFQSTNGDLAIVTDNNSNPAVYIKGTGTADLVNIFDNTNQIVTIKDGGQVMVGRSASDSSDSLLIVQGNAGDSGTGGQISIQRGGNANPTAPSDLGSITFKDSAANRGAVISAICEGDWASDDYPGALQFKVTNDSSATPTERVRINRKGALNVGSSKLTAAAGDGNIVVDEGVYISAYNGDYQIRGNSAGAGSATLYIGNAAIQTSSDRRLKENIVDTVVDAAEELKRVRVVDFTWNDPSDMSFNNRNARGTWTGLIAQELIDVFPFAVNAPRREEDLSIDQDSEKRWLVDQDQLVPVLIKAFQQSLSRIETLEAQNADLLARVTALEGS